MPPVIRRLGTRPVYGSCGEGSSRATGRLLDDSFPARGGLGDHGEVVTALVEGLRPDVSAEAGVSLVAEQEGEILGHVTFSRSLLDAPRRPWMFGTHVYSDTFWRHDAVGLRDQL